MGFPAGRAYLFLHGKPITKKDFDDLRDDFGVELKEIIKVVGEGPAYEIRKRIWRRSGDWRKSTAGKAPKHYYDVVLNHLKRRNPEDILLARFAAIVLDARARWTEAFCYDYRGGRTRIRTFLPSELRDLPRLFQLLRKPLDTLRIWLSAKDNAIVAPLDILSWICDQSRLEVTREDGQAFCSLMLMWPALERLLHRKGVNSISEIKYRNETLYELLAEDYGAAAHAIRNAIRGKAKASPSETLGQIIRSQLASTRSQATKPVVKRGRRPADVKERTYFKIGHAVEKEIPPGLKRDRHSIVAARRLITQRTRLQFDVVAQYHKWYRQTLAKPV